MFLKIPGGYNCPVSHLVAGLLLFVS